MKKRKQKGKITNASLKKLRGISLVAITMLIAVSITGCKEKDKPVEVNTYKTLKLSEVAKHRDRGDIKVTESNNSNNAVVDNKSDNLGNEFNPDGIVEQTGSSGYTTKFGYSQLNLINQDTTEYFEISGDDVIYNGVTYLGLNKALDSIEYPYDKTTIINFIVKTYDPMGTTVDVCCTIADDEGYVDGWTMSMDYSLSDSWDGYNNLKEQYGKIVKWELMLADHETFDRQSYMYGCSDYMIYLSYTSGEIIDMSNFEEIKP